MISYSKHIGSSNIVATCAKTMERWSFLSRKKNYDTRQIELTKLHRALTLFDITALGISCTLGGGVYILTTDGTLTSNLNPNSHDLI